MIEQEQTHADSMVHAVTVEGNIRCMAAITTGTVAEAARRHHTSHTVTAALGRTLTGALLLAAGLKELDRLTVQIEGDGPVGSLTAEADGHGHVRGYARHPEAEVPLNEHGKFDVRAVIGQGMLYVTHESGYAVGLYREPYRGSVPLVSGEIGEDFAYYLAKSEQIPSAVLLGVLVRARDSGETFVEAAGGMMIQVMPGADQNIVSHIEASVERMPHATKLIREGAGAIDMLRTALGHADFNVLDERSISFACACSYERAVSLISSIERTELESMLHEDQGAMMTCHFCNSTYEVNEAALTKILDERRVT